VTITARSYHCEGLTLTPSPLTRPNGRGSLMLGRNGYPHATFASSADTDHPRPSTLYESTNKKSVRRRNPNEVSIAVEFLANMLESMFGLALVGALAPSFGLGGRLPYVGSLSLSLAARGYAPLPWTWTVGYTYGDNYCHSWPAIRVLILIGVPLGVYVRERMANHPC
jgi:hypothetical protein